MGSVTVVSVSYNTKELTALLLWSLHRILAPSDISVLVVDNASTDGSAELLRGARDAGLCSLIENDTNLGHGPGLNVAMSATQASEADRVWILDSDCVVTRPDALREPLSAYPGAAMIGEPHWDPWREQERFELYSLLLDPAALREADAPPFCDDGDPAWNLLGSATSTGLEMKSFPFTAGGYIVHLGRGTLAAVAEAHDTNNPLYSWATEHREPHFGGVDHGGELHRQMLERFRMDVGPQLDLVAALRR